MSTTIMMPNAMEAAMKEMCSDAIAQAVEVLAAKYDFDVDEAARALEGVKIVRKRGPSPKTVASGGKAKVKKASDGDKPKRAKTGYLLYSDFIRATVRSELEQQLGADEKLKPQEVVKQIAARWKSELPSEKEAWNAAAKAGLPGPSDSGKAGRQEARVAEVAAEELNLSDEDDSDDDDDDEEDDE